MVWFKFSSTTDWLIRMFSALLCNWAGRPDFHSLAETETLCRIHRRSKTRIHYLGHRLGCLVWLLVTSRSDLALLSVAFVSWGVMQPKILCSILRESIERCTAGSSVFVLLVRLHQLFVFSCFVLKQSRKRGKFPSEGNVMMNLS